MSNKTIADETARARKILARNAAWRFSSSNMKKMELQIATDPKLGEYAILCLVGPFGAQQYTICHPVGITDLSDDDWVLIPTGEIPVTLSRRQDPNREEINKQRSVMRISELVEKGLLCSKKTESSFLVYYPSDMVVPRSAHLNEANTRKKAELRRLKLELSNLEKGDAARKQVLNSEIQRCADILQFLPESVRAEEIKVRRFLNDPKVEERIANKHPYLHRTMVGPFGDQPQRAITGARGFPLADVIGAMNKSFFSMDLSSALGVDLPKKSKVRRTRPLQGRVKRKDQEKSTNSSLAP